MPPSADKNLQHAALRGLLASAAEIIKSGCDFTEFRAELEPVVTEFLINTVGGNPGDLPADPALMAHPLSTQLALEIWNKTPVPENGFRPRPLAPPRAATPCPCGSKKKFGQCCGRLPFPGAGISEAMMAFQRFKDDSLKEIAALPESVRSLDFLAMLAEEWNDDGRQEDAISLLETIFSDLSRLDDSHEILADMLMDLYLDTDRPQAKQALIERLKSAPDKTLRSAAWQREAVTAADLKDYPRAWNAFQEAQRLSPNAPVLSHLEILLLTQEGRREEAKARAEFWSALLAKDSSEDYSGLIKMLRLLAEYDVASFLAAQAEAGTPLGRLARFADNFRLPEISHYKLGGKGFLQPDKSLKEIERQWLLRCPLPEVAAAPPDWLDFLESEPLASQSLHIFSDLLAIVALLPEDFPGANQEVQNRIFACGEQIHYDAMASQTREPSPKKAIRPGKENLLQLRIDIDHCRPPIWRRVLVRDSLSFADLHDVIQISMGWEDAHMHQFQVGNTRIGAPLGDDDIFGDETLDESEVTLGQAIGRKKSFSYCYDFGDSWDHTIAVEKRLPAEADSPAAALLTGRRACPPEDCGGVWGYTAILEALKDPEHPDHEEMLEYYGDWDEEDAQLAEGKARLKARFGKRR